MAAILNLTPSRGHTDNLVVSCCAVAIQSAIQAIYHGPQAAGVTGVIGGIVTAAGFPEIGIPIAVVGHLVGRWMTPEPAKPALPRL